MIVTITAMAINNHFKDKDIRKRLNNELLQQDFAAGERQAHTLTRYKEIAKGYALTENALAVLSDMYTNISYMYYGAFADELGIKRYDEKDETPSIWEKAILSRIHPDDLNKKYLHELQFLHFMKHQPNNKRQEYYYMCGLRMKDTFGNYRNTLHRIFYVSYPSSNNLWLTLCLYTPALPGTGQNGQIVNSATGQVQMLDNQKAGRILSDRETQVLRLIDNGLTSKQIAGTLSISIHTVNRHRQEIHSKLNVKSAIEACHVAKSLNIL